MEDYDNLEHQDAGQAVLKHRHTHTEAAAAAQHLISSPYIRIFSVLDIFAGYECVGVLTTALLN